MIIGKNKAVPLTAFRMQWPNEIKRKIVTRANPRGKLTISDLEMAGLLLLWLVMEDICPDIKGSYVALFSDNLHGS